MPSRKIRIFRLGTRLQKVYSLDIKVFYVHMYMDTAAHEHVTKVGARTCHDGGPPGGNFIFIVVLPQKENKVYA